MKHIKISTLRRFVDLNGAICKSRPLLSLSPIFKQSTPNFQAPSTNPTYTLDVTLALAFNLPLFRSSCVAFFKVCTALALPFAYIYTST